MAPRIACQPLTTADDVAAVGNCNIEALSEDVVNEAIDAASDALARFAQGWTLGRCTTVLRPCRDSCRGYPCGCCTLRGIKLDGIQPTVTSIKIDGEAITTGWAVITRPGGDKWLERFETDGRPAFWPGCQRIGLESTEEDTFEVTVETGLPIDILMRFAAAEIAADILGPYINTGNSLEDLPDGVASVDAYNMRMTMVRDVANSEGTEDDRLSGLANVKRFLAAYPPQTRVGSTVWAPEIADTYQHFVRS